MAPGFENEKRFGENTEDSESLQADGALGSSAEVPNMELRFPLPVQPSDSAGEQLMDERNLVRESAVVEADESAEAEAERKDESDKDESDKDESDKDEAESEAETSRTSGSQSMHLATSTFLSLLMVLGLLLLARLMVPSLVESIRYGWYRGQLRAEYELSGERLKSVSLDSLSEVSKLVSQRMGPSVVHIDVQKRLRAGQIAIPGMSPLEGQGSGFVIEDSGYILTNDHVLQGAGDVTVTLSDGRRMAAEIIGQDPHTDLAVLKIEAAGLMPVEWGDSDKIVVGSTVWAVGSPFGLQQTVTFGIISGKHRVDFSVGGDRTSVRAPYGDLMQSDVVLHPGNSGGPLVNSLGQVVGVNAAILGESFKGVSFSIPSHVAQKVAGHLITEGSVPRGWLGVVLEDLTQEEKYLDDGVLRTGVRIARFPATFESPAKKAGLKIGDIVVSFEGMQVESTANLIRMIGETEAGTTVTLKVERPLEQVDALGYESLQVRVLLERRDPRL
ncbi:MAG: trypsin-like peptidase domain-containing protein [Planctomycetota bacterium]|nr:trypsin-like peptidase domain-containing protein [Planctomycetota bacterium]